MYTSGTGFSGIGVPDLALELLGVKTVWQIENNPYCLKVLERHFPDAHRYHDVRDAHPGHVDIEVFGFPCQPFSNAGNQKGEADERYLVPEMLRVIDETTPRLIVLENVPGFASLDHGHSFKNLLKALAEMGFDAEWGHLSASDVGAPHKRERWFLVGYANGSRQASEYREWGNRRRSPDAERQGLWSGPSDNGGALGHPDSLRRLGSETAGQSSHHENGIGAARQQRGRSELHAPLAGGSVLVDASRSGRQEQHAAALAGQPRHPARRPAEGRRAGCDESGLGRAAHGFTRRLDFRGWPAGPGQAQYADEPARTVPNGAAADRNARIRALGNTMCFPLMFEILQSAVAWLQEADGLA